MEEKVYSAVKIKKMIFMQRNGIDSIIHGLFLDNIKTALTKKALMDESFQNYLRDFEITGGWLVDPFIGLSVEQAEQNC
jgi:hypothetical protein